MDQSLRVISEGLRITTRILNNNLIEEQVLKKQLVLFEDLKIKQIANKNANIKELMTLKEEMIEIRKKLAECEDREKKLSDKAKKIFENLQELDQKKASARKALDEVRNQIEELRRITVYVDLDIEMEPNEYEIPDGWKELRNSLIEVKKMENFTIGELTVLAKAVMLKLRFIEDGRKYDFLFDSRKMQQVFDEVTRKEFI